MYQQKITFKFLNQLKLMIKPPQNIVQITAAFVTLLGGCISSINTQFITDDWQQVKHRLKNTTEILEIIQNDSQFLKRVKKENLLKSIEILQNIPQEEKSEMFMIMLDCVTHLQKIAKIIFKFLPKGRSSSHTQFSSAKKLKTNESQMSSAKKKSPSTSSRNSSTSDLQKRVQDANNKKKTRLDKILKLQVNKPKAHSQVKSIMEGKQMSNKSLHSKSKDSILKQEIENNYKEIKKIQREENDLKWSIEKEAKKMQAQSLRNAQKDDIERYRISYYQEQKIKSHNRQNSLKQKIPVISRSNDRASTKNSTENSIYSLQSEYMQSSKYRMEYESNIKKLKQNLGLK